MLWLYALAILAAAANAISITGVDPTPPPPPGLTEVERSTISALLERHQLKDLIRVMMHVEGKRFAKLPPKTQTTDESAVSTTTPKPQVGFRQPPRGNVAKQWAIWGEGEPRYPFQPPRRHQQWHYEPEPWPLMVE